jgi:DNA-binding response OmpR family regulator
VVTDKRILLVEDDRTLRELIAEALLEDGYIVETAADGVVALDLAGRWQPDLVILDLMMPHMNGEEFSTAMRQLDGMASTPIIIVSASRHGPEVVSRMGAEVALRKPFDLFELTDHVNQFLR